MIQVQENIILEYGADDFVIKPVSVRDYTY